MTVNIPAYMPPRTSSIRHNDGQIPLSAARTAPASRAIAPGAAEGCTRTWIITESPNMTMTMTAGISTATKSAPTEVSVRMA